MDWRSWEPTTELLLNYPIPGHGLGLRKIYANPLAFSSYIPSKPVEFAEGTVFIKDIFLPDDPNGEGVPGAVTFMIKDSTSSLAQKNWIWGLKDPITGVETIVSTKFCVTCHANANEPYPYGGQNPQGLFQDYVFFLPNVDNLPPSNTSPQDEYSYP